MKRNTNPFYNQNGVGDKGNLSTMVGSYGRNGKRDSESGNGLDSSARSFYTPSPAMKIPVSAVELMCLNMMNFTSPFTFSFYELPEQYKERNLGLKNGGKSSKPKKGKTKK